VTKKADIDPGYLVAAYSSGRSYGDIALELGYDTTTVRNHALEAGVVSRPRSVVGRKGWAYSDGRFSTRHQRARAAVLKRDGACVRCGGTDRLEAHHITTMDDAPSLGADEANMVALCVPCHKWVHGKLGKPDGWWRAEAIR
jgi:5-methylcytosine-specific restriction endonuclease McrA